MKENKQGVGTKVILGILIGIILIPVILVIISIALYMGNKAKNVTQAEGLSVEVYQEEDNGLYFETCK